MSSILTRNSITHSPLSPRLIPVSVAIALAWVALSPGARAVSPPPDGGYPNANTAEGQDALKSLTTGAINTAVGFDALFSNTTGFGNTAIGFKALITNTTGEGNTATGSAALPRNTTGSNNTATGADALEFNTTGNFNTATGIAALDSNTTGSNNTATGNSALFSNTTGSNNTANGWAALAVNRTGGNNTADGINALRFNSTGSNNTAAGNSALFGNSTGNRNIALGVNAGLNLTTGNDNIDIGNKGVAGESSTIRIGTPGTQNATFIAGILRATVPSGVEVIVGRDGLLGTINSSQRFKEAIKPMGKASEAILSLKPVTFRYKRKLDPDGIPQFGLVAEQVEKVNPALVARDRQGKVITVRYEAVNAMLLNEFLKEHRKVQELEAAIAQQQKEIRALSASFKLQASQIGKVREASSQ